MATFPVTEHAYQLAQNASGPCLIVNVGDKPVYLDQQSNVNFATYSLMLVSGQSVNWSGSLPLWIVCAPGETSTISQMYDADTTVTPITNVTVDGPVEVSGEVTVGGTVAVNGDVNIGGGTVNVGTISGDVSVDGSTVNIGNNVRLWGGGDFLGYYDFTLGSGKSPTYYVDDLVPAILNAKYASLRLAMLPQTGIGSINQLWFLSAGYADTSYREMLAIECAIIADTNSTFYPFSTGAMSTMDMPILTDRPMLQVGVVRNTTATTMRVYFWGNYHAVDDAHVIDGEGWNSVYQTSGQGVMYSSAAGALTKMLFAPNGLPKTVTIIPQNGVISAAATLFRGRLLPAINSLNVPRLVKLENLALNANGAIVATLPASTFTQVINIGANAGTTADIFDVIVQ